MSSDDDDFLLPDNSAKPKLGNNNNNANRPFVGVPTPTTADDMNDAALAGFPGFSSGGGARTNNNNVGGSSFASAGDYASQLLSNRRRGLQSAATSNSAPQQQRSSPLLSQPSTTPVNNNNNKNVSPTTRSLSPMLNNPTTTTTAAPQFLQAPPPLIPTNLAADDPLMRILNPSSAQSGATRAAAVSPPPPPSSALDSTMMMTTMQPFASSSSPPRGGLNTTAEYAASSSVASGGPSVQQPHVPQQQQQPPRVVDPERIDKLRAELDAKKRAIASLREREATLLERVRSEKATTQAEIQLTTQQLKREWDAVEQQRREFEEERQRAELQMEEELRQLKKNVTAEVAKEKQPEIDALNAKLGALKEEEAAIRQSISGAASNKDVVTVAISHALSEIVRKLQTTFTDSAMEQEALQYEQDIRQLVKQEVQTAFAAGVNSSAETEQAEFARSFEEMLQFWREAELEEQRQLSKMDEQVLLDLQGMALEDVDRLQREEHAVEEVYMAAREEWISEHRKTLQKELDAAVERRTKELESIRMQRNEIHSQRLKDLEDRHKEKMETAKQIHQKRVELLKAEQAQQESLHEARLMMYRKLQEDAGTVVEGFRGTTGNLNRALTLLQDYQKTVEEGRSELDRDRQRSLELREATLADVQNLIVGQANAVESERRALGAALVKLEVIQTSLEKQLEAEKIWMSQLQSKIDRSKSDWEREYRRWQNAAAQEKRKSEARFHDILMELQHTAGDLQTEAKELEVEGTQMRQFCASRATAVAQEIAALEKRENDLQAKQHDMLMVLGELQSRSQALSAGWKVIFEERQNLQSQRLELAREEQELQRMSDGLVDLKQNVDGMRMESVETMARTRRLDHELALSKEAASQGLNRVRRHAEQLVTTAQQQQQQYRDPLQQNGRPSSAAAPQRRTMPSTVPDPNRLPMRVLNELRSALVETQQLRQTQATRYDSGAGRTVPSSAGSVPPPPSDHLPQQHYPSHNNNHMLHHHSSNEENASVGSSGGAYHMTQLVGLSEGEMTSLSVSNRTGTS